MEHRINMLQNFISQLLSHLSWADGMQKKKKANK